MRKKQTRRMLINAFRTAGADKIISGYLLWFFIAALPIWIWEPYTIGYGDYHAVTIVGRIITVILSVYSVAVIAIFTAVVTSFFTDLARSRKEESTRKFMDELEHLSELSKEELEDLSRRVKEFNRKRTEK